MNFYDDIMKDSSDPENGGSEEEEYPDDYYDGDQLVYYSDESIEVVDISDDGTHSKSDFAPGPKSSHSPSKSIQKHPGSTDDSAPPYQGYP
jgi:hypothetical protein